jgi:hypothetical protein
LNFGFHKDWFKGASLSYSTGYIDFARWNSLRAEFGFTPLSNYLGVPIVLWAQDGFKNTIAQYYRKSWAVGIAASLETFK